MVMMMIMVIMMMLMMIMIVMMIMMTTLCRPEIGRQEKMDKLVSVSNTVEHSSAIISDILSRQLINALIISLCLIPFL